MAERFFARLVGVENAGTFDTDLRSNQGVVKDTITYTPVSETHLIATFYNDIPVVATDGSPTVTFEYGADEPDWTGYVAVTDGDHASGYTLSVDTSEVDMDTIGTFDVVFTATDKSGNVSDAHTIEITIEDTTIPVITLTATTVDVEASNVATFDPLDNLVSAVDGYDGDVSADVTLTYKQDTSGGTAIADLAGAITYLGTEGNAVYVTYDVDDSSGNSATQKTATFTAVADS